MSVPSDEKKRGVTRIWSEKTGTYYTVRKRSLTMPSETVRAHTRKKKGGKRKTVVVRAYSRRKRGGGDLFGRKQSTEDC